MEALNDSDFTSFKTAPTFEKLCAYIENRDDIVISLDDNTLIVIDEFQEVIDFYTQLKFINEKNQFKNIICLGSFLTVKVFANKVSVPVGQIEMLTMHTLSFEEFLMNVNRTTYQKMIISYENKLVDEVTHNFLKEYFMQYLVIGGYPEAISAYLENNKNFMCAAKVNELIFENYQSDISKFIENENLAKVRDIFLNSIMFMGKESNTFTLSSIKTTARYRDYEYAILLLVKSHIVNKVDNCNNLIFPLVPMDRSNKFKIYPCDIALISTYHKVSSLNINSEGFNNIKGNMIETYIMSECVRNKIQPYYHTFRVKDNSYELDLVFQDEDLKVNLVEIKSGKNKKSRSLNKAKDTPNSKSITTSLDSLIDEHNIPLYMFGYMLSHKSK